MTSTDIESLMIHTLETKPACSQALKRLKSGTEIQLVVQNKYFALFLYHERAKVEARQAEKADVEFTLSPDAIEKLSEQPGQELGSLGVTVLKLIVAGEIQIKVIGSVLNVLTKGYLKIIKEAGPEFSGYLASHGFKSISKITAAIKSMKKS